MFAVGFLNSSVLFCSGAMAIVGSISAGTVGDYNLIFIKSVMDGSMAIIFAAAYGPGVLASALSVLVYQGFFTLMGATISPLLKESGLNELSAVGGILLIMIACNLIGIKQFKTGNFLPALILAPVFAYFGAYNYCCCSYVSNREGLDYLAHYNFSLIVFLSFSCTFHS